MLCLEAMSDYRTLQKEFSSYKKRKKDRRENYFFCFVFSCMIFYIFVDIIDRDFHKRLDMFPCHSNLFFTDYHDIEMMMFDSVAFDKIIETYTYRCKHKEEENATKQIKRIVLNINITDKIGYLKLANLKNNLGLTFKPKDPNGNNIEYGKFIKTDFSDVDIYEMIRIIGNYSNNKSRPKSIEQIMQAYLIHSGTEYNSYQNDRERFIISIFL